MRCDEEELYVPSFQRPESARLVDFLDRVRALPPPSPAYETDNKVLNATSATENTSPRCLRKLQAIFSHCTILPLSYIISGDLARTGSDPVTSGGFSDMWEGTHNDVRVCVTKQTADLARKHFGGPDASSLL